MKYSLILVLVITSIYGHQSFSQSLAINTTGATANASSILDVSSTLKGMLIPRMSRTERNAISSPATGLLIFQNNPDSIGLYYYNGSAWTWVFSNSNSDSLAWRTGGNTGTTDAGNFIGTRDNIPFNIRVNNQRAGRIDPTLFNTFLGYQSGIANTSGAQNTALGKTSLFSNTIGINNTALGVQSLYFNINGNENTGLGPNALFHNIDGNGNVAAGLNTMFTNTSGNYNTALGYYALGLNTTGYSNVAVGVKALYSNVSTNNLVAVGDSSLYTNTGLSNTAIGSKSMYSNTTAGHNVVVGDHALYTLSFSNSNTAWLSENVAVGDSSLYYDQPTVATNGYENTAVGSRSMRSNTNGYQNAALGQLSLYSNTNGNLNTATGWAALYRNDGGFYNTAVGAMAMYYNTSGTYNIGVGALALHNNVSGSYNTVMGQQAGLGATGQSYSSNTIIGYQAGYNLTTGSNNILLGNQAGYFLSTASNKLYISNTNVDPPLIYGDFSTGRIGLGTTIPNEKLEVNGNVLLTSTGTIYTGAGQTNMTLHSGDGTGSGGTMTIRGGNAGISSGGAGGDITIQAGANLPAGGAGYGGLGAPGAVNIYGSVGYNSVGGAINITAGATSCWSLVNGSHSDVNIQGGTDLVAADASSIVVQGGGTVGTGCPTANANGGNLILRSGIGTGTGTQGNIQLLNGNVGIGCASPAYKLHVIGDIASSGTVRSTNVVAVGAITACSDIRFKTNITPLQNSLQKLMQLNGVNYNWKAGAFPNMHFTDKLQVGFIAQDLEKIFPEMVFTDDDGYKSIDYSRLTPVLVETIKEQQLQIDAITKRLNEIEKMMNKQ